MRFRQPFHFLHMRDVLPAPGETVFRTARWPAAVLLVIGLGGFLTGGWAWWGQDLPWYVDAVVVIWLLVWVLVIWIGQKIFRKALRGENWLCRIGTQGLTLKLRSYLNFDQDSDLETVVYIPLFDVRAVRAVTRAEVTPAPGDEGDQTVRRQTLELELREPDQARQIARRVAEIREADRLRARGPGYFHDWPVSASGGVVRIEWRGKSARVTPGIDRALALLEARVRTSRDDQDTVDFNDLDAAGRARMIREMAARGETIDAVRALRFASGVSLTEAMARVEAILAEETAGRSPEDRGAD